MAGQIAQPKENKNQIQQQTKVKSKHGAPQARISVVGANGIPPINVNQIAQIPQPPPGSNYKTFYNWNTNNDYNYKIDVDKNEGKINHQMKQQVIEEETNENAENEEQKKPDSPVKQ